VHTSKVTVSEFRLTGGCDGQCDRYAENIIDAGSSISLSELGGDALSDALYRLADRQGLDVVAVPECALDESQLDALARFRFAQYLAAGFIDRDVAFRQRLDHDVLADSATYSSADSIHFIVSDSFTGQLLASMCLRGPPRAGPGVRVRDRDRPLFPVEEHFGWGVFNRLAVVPDTPIERVREFGRMVKSRHGGRISVGPRPAIELCLAASRLLVGTLSMTIDVCVGEFESHRVRRNLEFFHTPMAVIDGGLPAFGPGHPLNAALDGRDRYAFAFLVSDLASMASRLDAIEAALAKPDPYGLAALAELQRIPYETPSMLVPPDGIPALINTSLPQRSLSMAERRRARELGCRLRRFSPFSRLSDAECTALRMHAADTTAQVGRVLLARGEVADSIALVEQGRADLRPPGTGPEMMVGPGDCIGIAGVLAGAPAHADVVARTPMRFLRLPAAACQRLLQDLPDVQLELQRLALSDLAAACRRANRAAAASRPSRLATNSAEAMAALRAAGAVEREPALRNPDDLASALLSPQLRVHALAKVPGARRLIPRLAERLVPGGYHYETARVKHIDDLLRSELNKGLEQLVILGAGYDSRPYRFADALQQTRVLEVDLPQISAIKQRKAFHMLGRAPEHVVFVQADLLDDDVYQRLLERSYDLGCATLLILSGVTPYLPEAAVTQLFTFAGRHRSPRTSIAFDYVFREMVEGDDSFYGAKQTRRRLEALGEPLQFGVPAGGAADFLAQFGMTLDSDLQPDELARRYLADADGTIRGRPYGFAAIAHARVLQRSHDA
jgi:methyltransferase (TIGR00027 family)